MSGMRRFSRVCFTVLQTVCVAPLAHGQDNARDVGQINAKKLDEISGLAVSHRNPGILWVHNDGDSKSVYAVRTSGEVVARVHVPVDVKDLEDIAIGPGPKKEMDYLYLGDIGDNKLDRESVRILRFPEPLLSKHGPDINVPYLEIFSVTYPDGKHDAEALLMDPMNGTVLIVTKEKTQARLYGVRVNSAERPTQVMLQRFGELTVDNVSGGDVSRDGSRVILRRENRGWLWHRRPGQNLVTALMGRAQEIPVRGRSQGANGESVGFTSDGDAYYTVSEGKKETICIFRLDSAGAR